MNSHSFSSFGLLSLLSFLLRFLNHFLLDLENLILVPDFLFHEFLFGFLYIPGLKILLNLKKLLIGSNSIIGASDLLMELIVEHKVPVGPVGLILMIHQAKPDQILTDTFDLGLTMLAEIPENPDILLLELYQLPVIFPQQFLLTVMPNIQRGQRCLWCSKKVVQYVSCVLVHLEILLDRLLDVMLGD